MARRDGSWTIRLELDDGRVAEANTDQLTLDELDTAEQACGIPWAAMNPLRSARVAKALCCVLLIRAGAPQDKALDEAGRLTMERVADAFTYVPPTGQPLPEPGEGSDPPRSAPTSVAG